MKQFLESMCNGGFLHKPNNEVLEFLISIAELTRGWEKLLARETSNLMPNDESKRGIYQIDDNTDIRARLASLHRRLDDMSIKREVNAANEVANQPTSCHICLFYGYHIERCPSLLIMRETLEGQANFVEQYKAAPFRSNNNNGYGNTYNPHRKNHPTFL